MKRHEVSKEEWAFLDPLIPKSEASTGQPPRYWRQLLNGILWVLSTGAQWRDLPERFGPWETVYGYFRNWRADGLLDSIIDALHLRLDQHGKIDWDLWRIDGTSVRGTRSAAGATKKAPAVTLNNHQTTVLAAREAVLAQKSTSLSTGTARR